LVDEAHIPLNPRTSGAIGEEEDREEDIQLQALLIHDATMLSWTRRLLYIRNEEGERSTVMSSVKRILIIDDEKEITDGLKIGLEDYQFQVDTYNNPLEAISTFKPGAYHLAIIDVRMPEMNGFDVYKNLKKMDKDMKVCFFTAYDVYEEGFRGMFPELRSDCFLRKPMSISGMARAITQLLDAEPGPR
jgi:CheY-like chemotaxis protein